MCEALAAGRRIASEAEFYRQKLFAISVGRSKCGRRGPWGPRPRIGWESWHGSV